MRESKTLAEALQRVREREGKQEGQTSLHPEQRHCNTVCESERDTKRVRERVRAHKEGQREVQSTHLLARPHTRAHMHTCVHTTHHPLTPSLTQPPRYDRIGESAASFPRGSSRIPITHRPSLFSSRLSSRIPSPSPITIAHHRFSSRFMSLRNLVLCACG